MRRHVRHAFEMNKDVKNPQVLNLLIEKGKISHWTSKGESLGIALLGKRCNFGTARIPQIKQLCGLIECLAGGVI